MNLRHKFLQNLVSGLVRSALVLGALTTGVNDLLVGNDPFEGNQPIREVGGVMGPDIVSAPNRISSVPSAPASIASEAPSSARVENSVMQVRGVGARNPAQARTVHDPEASLNPALENRKKFAKFMKENKLEPEQLVPWLRTYLEDVLSKITPKRSISCYGNRFSMGKMYRSV